MNKYYDKLITFAALSLLTIALLVGSIVLLSLESIINYFLF